MEWTPILDSKRVIAAAYDPESATIHVRFPDGVEWWYSGCPVEIWETFMAPGTSRGSYIAGVLNSHPNGRGAG